MVFGCPLCDRCFAAVGIAASLYIALKLVAFVKQHFFNSVNLKKRYAKAGDWALVTGASEGIGEAMAVDLARRGFNVVVIARNADKLSEVVGKIQACGVQGKAIQFDFSDTTALGYKKLFNELDQYAIAVLVNNVGVNYLYPNNFEDVDIAEDLRILKVNCESQLQMTKYIVPKLKEKKSGAIVNLSSFTATTPTPMLATYAGTKAFMKSFSEALAEELRPFRVDVLAVTPNLVISKMTTGNAKREPKPSFLKVRATHMARMTLNQLGSTTVTSGHVNHAAIELVLGLLPTWFVSGQILKMHKDTKRRAEKNK